MQSRIESGTRKPVIDFFSKDPGSIPKVFRKVENDLYCAICNASYPVQWNYTGYISRSAFKFNNIDEYSTSLYGILTLLPYASEYELSLRIVCYSIEEPLVFAETFVYRWNRIGSSLVPPASNTTINSKTIPCATLNPKENVSLYLTTHTGEQKSVKLLDDTLEYRPTEGFISQHVFDDVYTCIQNTSNLTIAAISTESDEYQSFPATRRITQFHDQTIRLECSSASGHDLQISIHDSYSWTGKFDLEENDVTNSSLNVTTYKAGNSVITEIQVISEIKHRLSGNAKCIANNFANNETTVVKEWYFIFVEAPILELNHHLRTIECFSKYKVMMGILWCADIRDCEICRDQWKNGIASCSFQLKPTGAKTFRFISSSSYSQGIGLVVCGVEFGMTKQWNILETLDQRKRLSWMDAPTRELVRIDEMPYILYTNETAEFTCETLKYLFPKTPRFLVEFQNKSVTSIESTQFYYEIYEGIHWPGRTFLDTGKRLIEHLNLITTLYIDLPVDAVAIHCVAKWWNSSSKTLSASRRFITRHLLQPKILNVDQPDTNITHETFFMGESNRRLECIAEGEPTPEIRWLVNDTDVLTVFPELKTDSCYNGKCYLEFPKIEKNDGEKFAGEYLCVANNSVGAHSRIFSLNIAEKPDHLNVIYVIVAVTCGIILLGLLTTVVVLTRRYRRNKYMLRNLTQEEIDDFLNGRPAMAVDGTSIETVDFLPFDRNFEVPLSDLKFTFSEASLLGSGQFAFVVRGLVLSSGRPVAVKICKPSTDVTLFMSLLSEVKIMTYIGQHENILSLIGVCTEEIRSRSLYVMTDVCELGSLNNFLCNCKPHFVNLINGNQKIDVALVPQNLDKSKSVTTLDLIDFAAQIAKGMEYLAYKSVIHADLATRNALLTSNRTVKISDFGLSKKLYESTNYVKKSKSPLPWRWMALESLETLTFSTKSDVWSYGVTLYEILTLGNIPFPNESWKNDFVVRLKSGMRMGRPEFSTQDIYSKIVTCWENAPELRPEFGTLRVFFEELRAKYCQFPSEEEGVMSSDRSGSLLNANKNPEHITTKLPHYVNRCYENVPTQMNSYINLNV